MQQQQIIAKKVKITEKTSGAQVLYDARDDEKQFFFGLKFKTFVVVCLCHFLGNLFHFLDMGCRCLC